jgi:hypothetical protein
MLDIENIVTSDDLEYLDHYKNYFKLMRSILEKNNKNTTKVDRWITRIDHRILEIKKIQLTTTQSKPRKLNV